MSRLSRKNRTEEELGIRGAGGLNDLFDNVIKTMGRINDEELDFIVENMTDEDMEHFVPSAGGMTITECKKYLIVLEKYMNLYNSNH